MFDKKFWSNFIDVNENFSKTCVIENSFDSTYREILYNGVSEALFNRIGNNILEKGFRLYFEGEEVSQEDTNDFFSKNPPKDKEDIIKYCERVFSNKFGVIMNNNEALSEVLASNISEIMQPLFDIAGIPPLGNEITIFIGNYGWTPLGIHKDHVGENVLHFHLGPARKQMYTWDNETYEKLVGKNFFNNKNIVPILEHSTKFDFGEGDIFYMPWWENHVGYTEEISIGVSIWFQSTDNYTYSKKIIENFLSNFLVKDKKIIPPQINYKDNHDTYNYFSKIVFDTLDNKNPSLDDFLKKIYLDYKYMLSSNGNWANLPVKNYINDNEYTIFENKTIVLSKPFKIIYKNYKSEKLYIFVRGNHFSIKFLKEIVDLIDTLNNNTSINVNDFLNTIKIPKEIILYIILTLYRFKGIKIENKDISHFSEAY